MILLAGRRCYVNYGQREWHGRLVLDHVEQSDSVVATPDFDVFVQQLDNRNVDWEGFRVAPPSGGLPVGVPGSREQVYDFDALRDSDVAALISEGRELGAMERSSRGLRPGPVSASVVGAAPGLGLAALCPAAGARRCGPPGGRRLRPRGAGDAGPSRPRRRRCRPALRRQRRNVDIGRAFGMARDWGGVLSPAGTHRAPWAGLGSGTR